MEHLPPCFLQLKTTQLNSKKHPTLPGKRDSSFWKLTQVGTFLLLFVLLVYLLTVPFNFLLKAQVSSAFDRQSGDGGLSLLWLPLLLLRLLLLLLLFICSAATFSFPCLSKRMGTRFTTAGLLVMFVCFLYTRSSYFRLSSLRFLLHLLGLGLAGGAWSLESLFSFLFKGQKQGN